MLDLLKIIAGDTFEFEYVASTTYNDTYTATMKLIGQSTITITAASEGNTHTFEATATTTKLWNAGIYRCIIIMSLSGAEYTVEQGNVVIEPRPDYSSQTDYRTFAERTLEAIESVLEGRAGSDMENYTINGRSVTKIPMMELMRLHTTFKRKVAAERGQTLRRITARYLQ